MPSIKLDTDGIRTVTQICTDYRTQFPVKASRSYSSLTKTYFYNVTIKPELAEEIQKVQVDYASCLLMLPEFTALGYNVKLTPMNKYGFCGSTISVKNDGLEGGFIALSGEGKTIEKALFSLHIKRVLIDDGNGNWLYTDRPMVDDREFR